MTPKNEGVLREENKRLKDENKRLIEENEKWKREFEKTKKKLNKTKREFEGTAKDLEETKKEFEDTKKEFEEYKALHVLTVNELRKALNFKGNNHKKSKKLGAPKGHKGYTRHIPERIDYVEKLEPVKCPTCDSELSDTQEIRQRYMTDLEFVMSVKTTRFDIHRKYCSTCGKIVELKPKSVLPRARFGLKLMLFVMYLKLGLRTPSDKIVEFMRDIHGLTMSESEVYCILTQLSKLFGVYYEDLKKLLNTSKVKHTDSTTWWINGKRYAAWVFITAGVVLYEISKRNNHKTPLKIFGAKQKNNILVVDRHSAFRTLAKKRGFILQLCWSHILDDSKDLKKCFGAEGKYVHERLKKIFADAKKFNHKGTKKDVEHLEKRIFLLTCRHYKNHTVKSFVNNLYNRDHKNLFIFVTNPDVDPTNNISERELRKLVIIRNISNGSRSKKGAKNTVTLLSVLQTLRNTKQNLFQQLEKQAIASLG